MRPGGNIDERRCVLDAPLTFPTSCEQTCSLGPMRRAGSLSKTRTSKLSPQESLAAHSHFAQERFVLLFNEFIILSLTLVPIQLEDGSVWEFTAQSTTMMSVAHHQILRRTGDFN